MCYKLDVDSSTSAETVQQDLLLHRKYKGGTDMISRFEHFSASISCISRYIQRIERMEMEKYKVDFSLSVEDEATKKIQEVISGIDKMFK